MSEKFSKVDLITGFVRRRSFTTEQKLAVVSETLHLAMVATERRRTGR
jgi:hypothetical protein